jgi:hypothetical protein
MRSRPSRTAPLEIATILEGPLLDLSDPLNRWYRWSTWLAALKQAPAGKLNTLEFDSYSTLVSAALAGHGIALCWSGILDQYLETGSLLRISEHAAKSHRGYYVTTPMSTSRNAKLARVTSWLIKESVTSRRLLGSKAAVLNLASGEQLYLSPHQFHLDLRIAFVIVMKRLAMAMITTLWGVPFVRGR